MKILDYIKEAKGELAHVSWPTRSQTIAYTALVIAISLITAAYLGLLDYVFTLILTDYVLSA